MNDPGDEDPGSPPPRPPLGSWLSYAMGPMADALASMYGGRIYMVGSALQLVDPGDVDIRCRLSLADYERLFGTFHTEEDRPKIMARRYREELKQSRRLWKAFKYRFDFQFQTEKVFDSKIGPRVRVDALDDYVFTGGLGDP